MDSSTGGSGFNAAETALTITVVGGVGVGNTLLSSFDDALRASGVYNYNLLTLSSVIPPGSCVRTVDIFASPPAEHGFRLYVVKADQRSDRPGEGIAAGIGWYQWGDGRGVFVEHECTAPTASEAGHIVAAQIRDSLRDLCAFRNIPFEDDQLRSKVTAAPVTDGPTSVIVAAVFKSESWS